MVNINSELLKKREILIDTRIDEELAVDIIRSLRFLSSQNNDQITLSLNTKGGDPKFALDIAYNISLLKVPITTVGLSRVDSAGLIILTSGTVGQRKAIPSCTFSPHIVQRIVNINMTVETSQEYLDLKTKQHRQDLSEFQDTVYSFFKEKTGNSLETLRDLFKRERPLTTSEACRYHFIDSVISKP